MLVHPDVDSPLVSGDEIHVSCYPVLPVTDGLERAEGVGRGRVEPYPLVGSHPYKAVLRLVERGDEVASQFGIVMAVHLEEAPVVSAQPDFRPHPDKSGSVLKDRIHRALRQSVVCIDVFESVTGLCRSGAELQKRTYTDKECDLFKHGGNGD